MGGRLGCAGLLAGLLLVSVVRPAAGGAGEPREWLLSTIAPEGSPSGNTVDAIARLLTRASGGGIKAKRRMGGVLGDEQNTALRCQKGQIQVWAGSLGALVPLVPELRFLEQPYMFPDIATFRRVMKPFQYGRGPELAPLFERRGLVPLGVVPVGWRNISTVRRPVRSPADLRGMSVRVQPGGLHDQIWKTWGAVPRPIALTELNSALEVRLVEAFDVQATFVYATSLDARIKYYTITRHVFTTGVAVVNKEAWDGLPEAWRRKIRAGADEIISRGSDEHIQFDEDLIALLPRRGVEIIRPGAAEMAEFRSVAAPVERHIRATASAEELRLFERIKGLVDKARLGAEPP